MTVPFAFANLSGNIALAKLDSNFNTPITIGNTSVLLGNTITTINNVTLANVTISSGTASNISLTSPLAVSSGGTGSANLTVNNVLIGNGTSAVTSVAPGTTGNVLTSIGGAWVSNVALTSVAAGSNTQVQYNSANLLAGSANFVFDGTNVGIGTSSPVSALTLANAKGVTWFNASGSFSSTAGSQIVKGNDNNLYIDGYDGATVFRGASFAERMRLDSSGNLLVGQTAQTTTERVGVTFTGNNNGAYFYNTSASPTGTGVTVNYGNVTGTNTTTCFLFTGRTAGGDRFYVYGNGGIANYQANNVNLSDRREKTNFAPAKSYLDAICAIPVQTFNYIDQSEDDLGLTLGVVAQDVQAVAPELVSESNWGTEAEPKTRLSIYQTDLQYALMKCIQELKAEVDSLKTQLEAKP